MRAADRRPCTPRTTGILLVSVLVSCLSAHGADRKDHLIAGFAQEGELQNWKLGNSGVKSKIELVPGPENTTAAQVTCVYETGLGYYGSNDRPYMPFTRAFDGPAAAKAGATRICFWYKGDAALIVFEEKGGGCAYRASVSQSNEWCRTFVAFSDLRYGWGHSAAGKSGFDLARMGSFHVGASPPPARGKPRTFAVALFNLETVKKDLPALTFMGGKTPARLDLYPRELRLPVNRTQPLLVVVRNEEGSGLRGVEVELRLKGAGGISPDGKREDSPRGERLQVVTDEEGKARARFHPTKAVGQRCVVTARIVTPTSVPPAQAALTTAQEIRKVTFGPDGFFVRPDGNRVIPLGGLYLPWLKKVVDGKVVGNAKPPIVVNDEATQRAWFAYLKDNGVNCVRGYWWHAKWGKVMLGPGGTYVPHQFCVDGKINEPVVAALERTLALAGEYGIGVTLTIADCAMPFIVPGRDRCGRGDRSMRLVEQQATECLRELVPRLMFNPNVWAYELVNEQATDTFQWSERFIQTIKELDEVTPVMVSHSGGGLQRADPLAWMRNTSIDIYQPHLYPSETRISPKFDAGLAQEIHYNGMQGPKPWLLGEAGWWYIDPAVIRCHVRDDLWFALLNRACGAFLWGPEHVTPFKMPSKIAPLVDWKALSDAPAMVGVAVPRDTSKATFFVSAEGRQALKVMADYAGWGLENGVTVDFVLDAAGYEVRRSALEPFDPPRVKSPFTIGKGYQFKYRMSREGKLVVGYLRNVARISKFTPKTGVHSATSKPSAYFRVRKPLTAELKWKLPAEEYSLTVWDLDTAEKTDVPNAAQTETWRQEHTDHDFILMWKVREQ